MSPSPAITLLLLFSISLPPFYFPDPLLLLCFPMTGTTTTSMPTASWTTHWVPRTTTAERQASTPSASPTPSCCLLLPRLQPVRHNARPRQHTPRLKYCLPTEHLCCAVNLLVDHSGFYTGVLNWPCGSSLVLACLDQVNFTATHKGKAISKRTYFGGERHPCAC